VTDEGKTRIRIVTNERNQRNGNSVRENVVSPTAIMTNIILPTMIRLMMVRITDYLGEMVTTTAMTTTTG